MRDCICLVCLVSPCLCQPCSKCSSPLGHLPRRLRRGHPQGSFSLNGASEQLVLVFCRTLLVNMIQWRIAFVCLICQYQFLSVKGAPRPQSQEISSLRPREPRTNASLMRLCRTTEISNTTKVDQTPLQEGNGRSIANVLSFKTQLLQSGCLEALSGVPNNTSLALTGRPIWEDGAYHRIQFASGTSMHRVFHIFQGFV